MKFTYNLTNINDYRVKKIQEPENRKVRFDFERPIDTSVKGGQLINLMTYGSVYGKKMEKRATENEMPAPVINKGNHFRDMTDLYRANEDEIKKTIVRSSTEQSTSDGNKRSIDKLREHNRLYVDALSKSGIFAKEHEPLDCPYVLRQDRKMRMPDPINTEKKKREVIIHEDEYFKRPNESEEDYYERVVNSISSKRIRQVVQTNSEFVAPKRVYDGDTVIVKSDKVIRPIINQTNNQYDNFDPSNARINMDSTYLSGKRKDSKMQDVLIKDVKRGNRPDSELNTKHKSVNIISNSTHARHINENYDNMRDVSNYVMRSRKPYRPGIVNDNNVVITQKGDPAETNFSAKKRVINSDRMNDNDNKYAPFKYNDIDKFKDVEYCRKLNKYSKEQETNEILAHNADQRSVTVNDYEYTMKHRNLNSKSYDTRIIQKNTIQKDSVSSDDFEYNNIIINREFENGQNYHVPKRDKFNDSVDVSFNKMSVSGLD